MQLGAAQPVLAAKGGQVQAIFRAGKRCGSDVIAFSGNIARQSGVRLLRMGVVNYQLSLKRFRWYQV